MTGKQHRESTHDKQHWKSTIRKKKNRESTNCNKHKKSTSVKNIGNHHIAIKQNIFRKATHRKQNTGTQHMNNANKTQEPNT